MASIRAAVVPSSSTTATATSQHPFATTAATSSVDTSRPHTTKGNDKMSISERVDRRIWGDTLTMYERRKFSWFAAVFFLLLGGYWMIRPLKMGVFIALVGLKHEPTAKLGTVAILIPLLIAYNKVVSASRGNVQRLVYFVFSFYAGMFVLISFAISIASPHEHRDGDKKDVQRRYGWLGWTTYWTIETYGSICVAMVWSLIADSATGPVATVAFPVMIVISQVGAVIGSSSAKFVTVFGFSTLFFAQAVNVAAIILMCHRLLNMGGGGDGSGDGDVDDGISDTTKLSGSDKAVTKSADTVEGGVEMAVVQTQSLLSPTDESTSSHTAINVASSSLSDDNDDGEQLMFSSTASGDTAVDKSTSSAATAPSNKPSKERGPPTGLWEGIRLIITHKYVAGIAVVSSFNEIVTTIMDFNMKMMAKKEITDPKEFASFMGSFGQASNVVSLLLAICGTKYLISRLGLHVSLLAFPAGCLALVLLIWALPSLWVAFTANVLLKALKFSLNNPAKELLYIQTSTDIKYKAKSWVDMFGTRGAKAVGSVVNNAVKRHPEHILSLGSVISVAFVAVWAVVAHYVGLTNRRMVENGERIA